MAHNRQDAVNNIVKEVENMEGHRQQKEGDRKREMRGGGRGRANNKRKLDDISKNGQKTVFIANACKNIRQTYRVVEFLCWKALGKFAYYLVFLNESTDFLFTFLNVLIR